MASAVVRPCAMRASALPVSLSDVILNSTTATAAMGTITMIVKKMKSRPRNDIGPPMYRQFLSVPLQAKQGARTHEADHSSAATIVHPRGYSSAGRAPGSHPGGRGFESP